MTNKKPGVDYSTDKFLNGVESSNCTALLEESHNNWYGNKLQKLFLLRLF